MAYRNARGVSLFELLLALSILTIAASFALPAMSAWLEQVRHEATRDLLLTHIKAARTLSIKRRQTVVLCPLDDQGCGEDWSNGWQIRDPANDELLLRHAELPPGLRLRWNRTTAITYRHNGTSAGLNGTLSLCSTNGKELSRITINNQGRARTLAARNDASCLE